MPHTPTTPPCTAPRAADGPDSAAIPLPSPTAHFLSRIPPSVRGQTERHDPRLPPCPLCGAPAFAGGKWVHSEDIRHDCPCDIDRAAEYYLGLRLAYNRHRQLNELRSVIPTRSQNASADDYPGAPVPQALIAAGVGRFVYGGPGSGKTHLGAAVALAAARAGRSVRFWSANALLDVIRRAKWGNAPWPDAATCGLLVLDDLAKCKANDLVYEQLYTIANARWEKELPTIYTANHPPTQTARALTSAVMFPDPQDREAAAAALASRFSWAGTLNLDGEDRRARP